MGYAPKTGDTLTSDGKIVNIADKIEAIHKAALVDKTSGFLKQEL